jgi:hypothetical protein
LASAALSGYDARLFPSRIVFMRPDKEKIIDEVFDDERIR